MGWQTLMGWQERLSSILCRFKNVHLTHYLLSFSDDFDGPPGVRNAKLTCHEGSVTWYNPVGALRLEISPTFTKAFRLCFVTDTGTAEIKVSQESDQIVNTKSASQRSAYVLNDSNLKTVATASGASKEHCISSEEAIILYIEPEYSGALGYQKVLFQYDVKQVVGNVNHLIEG